MNQDNLCRETSAEKHVITYTSIKKVVSSMQCWEVTNDRLSNLQLHF